MKKLLQICLIVILVFVFLQAATVGGEIASVQIDGATAGRAVSTVSISAEGTHLSACIIRIKGVVCVMPNVGWNS